MSVPLLAWHFFLLSFVAFGAATSVVPDLHRILVDDSGTMTDAQFANLFALSQAAPGTNVMFVAVLGLQAGGLPGAIASTVAFCSPTAVIALLLERFAERFRGARWNQVLRRSLVPLTIGLLLSTGYLLGHATPTPGGVLLTFVATLVLTYTRLTPLWLTALGAVLGALGWI